MPQKRYSIIYADPPWDYGERPLWCRGGAGQHYATQSVDWIADLPVPRIAAWHSACFLWATFPKLPEALYVLRHWGFEYRTVAFTWVKLNAKSDTPFFGMGQWTRANAEICLLATRGTVARRDKSVPQVIASPPTEHSRKPDEARERIVRLLGDLPRIELFARPLSPLWPKAEGWDVWGDEVQSDIDFLQFNDPVEEAS
jgi:N6-adenosine-specific RNA methylase IME4